MLCSCWKNSFDAYSKAISTDKESSFGGIVASTVEVDEETGLRNFYTQLLTGDTSDNIKGIAGIGPVKAKKALAECFTEQEMFSTVREMYENDEWMIMNGRCLYILRSLDDDYQHHFERLSNGE